MSSPEWAEQYEKLASDEELIREACEYLKVGREDLLKRIKSLVDEYERLQLEMEQLQGPDS